MNESQIVTVGKGDELFKARFKLNMEIWTLSESVVRVRADHLKDVTIEYITKAWEDEQHQPFGLGEDDLVGFIVERVWENNDA